ncbi:type VII secretion target [Amycolatopsis jejuensis]|uniref:type VII secretion target n=1 Tax=Amycolatopsis jejuensis TaxID=330084 RepID=UPI000524ED16|nr:type VII secretion target [Amycolatopsis jejuensis]
MSHTVVTTAITKYSTALDHYKGEAAKFGNLVGQADVGDKSWGVIGLAVKQTYTSKLDDLKQLLEEMKTGVEALQTKLNKAAEIYDGHEKDTVMTFGKFQAKIDGPL